MYDSTNQLENAQAFASRLGFALLPIHAIEDGGVCSCGRTDCDRPAKHPLTKNGLTGAAKDDATLQRYFGGVYAAANIAAATGSRSGVWVLDVDDLSSLSELESQYGTLPPTWTVETGNGGRHFYFRYPADVEIRQSVGKVAPKIDVRAEDSYVILPPSLHASGKRYRWLVSPDEAEIADAPDWLVTLARRANKKTATTESNPGAGGGERSEPLPAARGAGERGTGNSVPPTDRSPDSPFPVPPTAITIGEGGNSPSARLLGYLSQTPPAIAGEGGHNRTFGVVCRIVELFGADLTDDELIDGLQAWNDRCVPPWSESDLRHKVAEARRRCVVPASAVADAQRPTNDAESDGEDDIGQTDVTDDPLTLSEDALYGFAGDFVKAIEPSTEADNAAILVTFLVAFGNAVGRSAYFPVGGDRHYANLYACLVGDSSRARKGTSLGYVLDAFDGVDEAWNERRVSGLSSGEGIVNALRDVDASDPLTIADKRLWIVESEFAQALRVLKREGNTLSSVLRNAWDRGELSILTKANPLRATGAHVSILAHVTSTELRRQLSDVDVFNGFANRFLWVAVKRSKLLPDGGRTPSLDALRSRLSEVTQRAKTIGMMRRSEAASALWRSVYGSLVTEKPEPLWDAVTSRGEAQTLRLSLLYALLDGSECVDVPHLRAALALWRYCDTSARLVFGDADGKPETLDEKIVRIVRERPGIMRSTLCNAVSRKTKAADFDAAFARLATRAEIESVFGDRGSVRFYPGNGERGSIDGSESFPVPRSPDATEAATPDSPFPVPPPAKAVAEDDFLADFGATPQAASLDDLLDWRNQNGATVYRRVDGSCWVTPDETLTPSLRLAIEANQETLALFAPREAERPFA